MNVQSKALVATALLVAVAITCASLTKQGPYHAAQMQLAHDLGVRITDFPYPEDFPEGYFSTVLQEGMSADQVHAIIRGYAKVFRCSSAFKEVYYYFSGSDAKALRFTIYYDMHYKYLELGTEDKNSRTISVNQCVPGLLGN